MPTDLTGTPTALGIGTYNVDADAPSGLGFNGAMGQIDALIAARAPLASPAFTGTPTAPTPAPSDVSTKIATTSFVATNFAPLASPAFTGTPTAPTPGTSDNTTKIATTAFVKAQGYLTTAVASFNTRTGAVVPTSGDYTAAQVTNAADKSTSTNQTFNGGVVSNKGTGGGVGYATGAGATATLSAAASNPLTSTGALSGTITAVSSVPSSGSTYYGVSGGGWSAGDVILVSLVNGTPGTANNYYATVVSVGAGTFSFYFFNAGASAITPVFNFVALKAVTS